MSKMTVRDVLKRVEEIRAMADDYENAHGMEDSLRLDVLRAVAGGARNARALAVAALKTEDIDFRRVCA